MSLKQTNSLSTIPFSWEMIPGVPKCMASPTANSAGSPYAEMTNKPSSPPPPPPLPPPGCFREPNMRRSVSSVFWREEDPFLAALKECSKDYKVKSDKKRFGIWGSKSFLWCRCSFDVEEGNLRKRPLQSRGGPVSSQERFQGLIRMHKGSRKWNT